MFDFPFLFDLTTAFAASRTCYSLLEAVRETICYPFPLFAI